MVDFVSTNTTRTDLDFRLTCDHAKIKLLSRLLSTASGGMATSRPIQAYTNRICSKEVARSGICMD